MGFLKNRTTIGAMCIFLSLFICFVLAPLFSKGARQNVEIVRVVKEIRDGDKITEDMIKSVKVGGYNLPEGVLRKKDEVVGKYASFNMTAGDYILSGKISDEPAADSTYLYSLDGSRQAMSVTIKNFASGLSGKLQNGDIVSVIAPDYKKQGLSVIPPELKYVKVIGVTAASGYDANTEKAYAGDERELPSTITVLVNPLQSRILAELEADGKMHFSLVYRGNEKNAAKFIKAQEQALPEPESKAVEGAGGEWQY